MASATATTYIQQDFSNNQQRLGDISTLISTSNLTQTQLQQQPQPQANLIMINQFNIIHHHHHQQQQQFHSCSSSSSTPLMTASAKTTTPVLLPKIEEECDGYLHCYNHHQGPPPSSSSPSSVSSTSSTSDNNYLRSRDFMSEIDSACRLLSISADPYNWSQTDVRKWLMYQQRLHQLKLTMDHISHTFDMDGMSLCELTVEDFHQRILNSIAAEVSQNNSNLLTSAGNPNTWHCATVLYNELNIWRNAITNIFEPDLAFFDLADQPHHQQQQQNYDPLPVMSNQHSKLPMMDPCGSPASSPPSKMSSSYGSAYNTNHNQQMPYVHHMNGYEQHNHQMNHLYNASSSSSNHSLYSPSPSSSPSRSPCSPAGSSHSSMTSMASNYITDQQQPVNHITVDANHKFTNSYSITHHQQQNGSDATAVSANNCGNDYYFGHHQQPSQQMLLNTLINQQQQTSDYGSDSGALSDDDMSDDERLTFDYHHNLQQFITTGEQQQNSYPMMIQQQKFQTLAQQPAILKQINHVTSTNPTRPHGSSSSIQLWQFLKELLAQPHQYGNAIRWLERPRGVFKIEDSVRVARLWGERKNRPAMNYDKLSRSIRQYYKKGIMKKTERAQRLVYQFCQPYGL